MKSPRHSISRIAFGGVATAVAATALVGAATTAAQASSATTTYTCSALGSTISSNVFVDIPLLPPTAPAGASVPAGLLSYNSTITAPSALGITSGKSDDFAISIGTNPVKAPVSWAGTPNSDPTSTTTYSGKGANPAFVLPGKGTYTVTMPKTFTLQATSSTLGSFTATCTSASPTAFGSVTLSQQTTTLAAKVKPAKLKAGKPAKVQVKISNEYVKTGGEAVTGKVTVKDGKKKAGSATIKNGKATVKLKGLTAGTHKLTVSYKGDDFSGKAKAKLTVKVTK